jgi:hypothetical protein
MSIFRPSALSILVYTLILICSLTCNSASAADSVRIVATPGNGQVPDAEIDGDGNIHLAYVAGDNVYYVMSKDSGKTFSNPIRVNTRPDTAHPPHTFRGPDIAIGKAGQVHIIWYTNSYQRKRPKREWGVYYSNLNDAKSAFTTERNLNAKPSDNYSVAADGSGNVAVVWMEGGLYLNLSKNGGKTFSKAYKAKVDPCECCASRAHYSSKGNLHVFYRQKAQNLRDMHLLAVSATGRSSQTKVSPQSWKVNACPMTGAYLTQSDSKNMIAAWETNGSINLAKLEPTGRLLKPGKITAAARGRYPVALSRADGAMIIAWKQGQSLKWRIYDAQGKAMGQTESVSTSNPNRFAGVSMKNGDWVLFK